MLFYQIGRGDSTPSCVGVADCLRFCYNGTETNIRERGDIMDIRNLRERILTLAIAAIVLPMATHATNFFWRGGGDGWFLWSNASKWSTVRGENTNPDGLVPGASDSMWGYGFVSSADSGTDNGRVGFYNLGGTDNAIGSFFYSPEATNWKSYYHFLTNGTLTIGNPSSGPKAAQSFKLYDGAKLVFPAGNGSVKLGVSGLFANWEIGANAAMDVRCDDLQVVNLKCSVASGGSLRFDPGTMGLVYDSNMASEIVNHGTLVAPHGIRWNGGTGQGRNGVVKTLNVVQNAGTVLLGGDFTKTTVESARAASLAFTLAGGTLVASNAVAFTNSVTTWGNEVSASMTGNATVNVLADSSLDMGLFTYSDGVALTKQGPGTLKLKAVPASMTVQGGKVVFEQPVSSLSAFSFAAGTAVSFGAPGNVASTTITGYSGLEFSVEAGAFQVGDIVLSSADAGLLAYVREQIESQAPEGTRAVVSGGAVRFAVNTGAIFTSQGEFDLGTAGCWNVSPVPAGEDVSVSGAETVGVLSPSSPTFTSISVVDGATLKITGVWNSLPSINLAKSGRLLISENANVALGLGTVSCAGDASGLPVFEIATNAVCMVPGGYVFKNVDLRLFGCVQLDETTSGNVVFGGADAGETNYFAMTSIGGSVYAKGNSGALRRFVSPESGGCVKVAGSVLLKDVSFLPDPWTDGVDGFSGFYIGNRNPADETFSFVLDGTVLPVVRYCYIEGGAQVLVRNGGGFRKVSDHPGVATTFAITQKARVRMEGRDVSLTFSHADSGSFQFSPWVEDIDAFTIADGARVSTHDLGGSSVRLVVSNGVWCVPTLPLVPAPGNGNPQPPGGDARNWMTNAFCCFNSVHIEPGAALYFQSSSDLGGTEWDRHMTLANKPITGGGDFVMTNGTPGHAFTATVVSGANTSTGRIFVSGAGDPTMLFFNDGANWAGTVVADGRVALTNETSETAARVSFGTLELTGDLPIRVWRQGNGTIVADRIDLDNALAGTGRIRPTLMSGKLNSGEAFVLGSYSGGSAIPDARLLPRNWKFRLEQTGEGQALLYIVYTPAGVSMSFR